VTAAKTGWLQGRQVQRSQDGPLALRLQQLEHDKRTMAFDGALEKKIETLTPEQREAFIKLLKSEMGTLE